MRILILGATGMFGHCAFKELSKNHEVYGTIRRSNFPKAQGIPFDKIIPSIDVTNLEHLEKTIKEITPELVINCIGIIKQLKEAYDPITSITLNSLFPHQLAKICKQYPARMIHISTDCVFDGKKGSYTESDLPNATDLYGQTKALGEVKDQNHVITIRTSIIGRELETQLSLIDWFLAQEGKKIKGFSKAIYTGLTTKELCRVIEDVIIPQKELHGLYQISSSPIDKYHLLKKIKERFHLKMEIENDESFVLDRSLDSSLFKKRTGYEVACWDKMIEDLDILEH